MYKKMIVPFLCLALFGILASALPRELLQNDIVALNYALTLENLEAYFYNTYSIYSQSDFNNAGIKAKASYFTLIKAHENAHVAALTETIESLGGVAATPW